MDRAARADDAIDMREQCRGLGGAIARIEHHDLDGGSGSAERVLERFGRHPARLAVGALKVQAITGDFAVAAILADHVPAGRPLSVMPARHEVAAATTEVHHRGPELA